MARKISLVLLAFILTFLSISSKTIASDSPASSFVEKTCNEATYSDLCLNTLLPNADRINGSPKKAIRLAIAAVQPQIQTTSDDILNLSEQPQLWAREVNALNQCNTVITSSFSGVLDALQASNKLGGGSKGFKEAKRIDMEDDLKKVIQATNTCTSTLQSAKARDDVVNRVNEATELLVQLATNAVNLIHHMEF